MQQGFENLLDCAKRNLARLLDNERVGLREVVEQLADILARHQIFGVLLHNLDKVGRNHRCGVNHGVAIDNRVVLVFLVNPQRV